MVTFQGTAIPKPWEDGTTRRSSTPTPWRRCYASLCRVPNSVVGMSLGGLTVTWLAAMAPGPGRRTRSRRRQTASQRHAELTAEQRGTVALRTASGNSQLSGHVDLTIAARPRTAMSSLRRGTPQLPPAGQRHWVCATRDPHVEISAGLWDDVDALSRADHVRARSGRHRPDTAELHRRATHFGIDAKSGHWCSDNCAPWIEIVRVLGTHAEPYGGPMTYSCVLISCSYRRTTAAAARPHYRARPETPTAGARTSGHRFYLGTLPLYGDHDGPHFECWDRLGSLAEQTSQLIGNRRSSDVTPTAIRALPTWLGTVDHISGGRSSWVSGRAKQKGLRRNTATGSAQRAAASTTWRLRCPGSRRGLAS